MRVKPLQHLAAPVLSGAVITLLVGMASSCFLRNLGVITGSLALGLNADTAQTLSDIFGQLQSASLNMPLEITGPVCFLLCGLAAWFIFRKPAPKRRIVTVCVLGVILFMLLTAVTIWFTKVNDIRFDRVMIRLVSLLKAGIL